MAAYMKASNYIIDFLAGKKVTHVFEVAGGALGHLLDSLYERSDIKAVSMHSETAAAMAAEGYARASGRLGVAMATSGPGATNMITGIGSCYFDSIPCLFITGQVNTYEYKFGKPVRQVGFQETDIVQIVEPITKFSMMVRDPESLPRILGYSVELAFKGRPGPVLLDLPLNIQRSEIKLSCGPLGECNTVMYDDSMLLDKCSQVYTLIKEASRPIILAGGGVRAAKATERLLKFAEKLGIPVVTSLMGLDSFPHDHPLFVGMIGVYGNRPANLTIANADLIIALGTRLDTRQTGSRPETFGRGATIVHVDIDSAELHSRVKTHYPIESDVGNFLSWMLSLTGGDCSCCIDPWLALIEKYKAQYDLWYHPLSPQYFLSLLSSALSGSALICVDVGQIQMWSAQTLKLRISQRFLTEGGMASMGSALPLAIGAAFAQPHRQIVAIVGDGGFQLNIQELQTVYHHQLPIKIIMLNNHGYGMIKQFQEQYFDSRFQSSGVGYSNPDFQAVVSAYKIPVEKSSGMLIKDLERFLSDPGPGFLEIDIDESSRVQPKLSVGRPIEDQEPLLSREELKSNMLIDLVEDTHDP